MRLIIGGFAIVGRNYFCGLHSNGR